MRAPHFVRLAQIDEHRFISACRHGLVHLTWGRVTLRFRQDEFRQLATILTEAVSRTPPMTRRTGALAVTQQFNGDCEIRIGPLSLHLASSMCEEFERAAQEAIRQLDEVLASGMWEREPEEPPPSFEEMLSIPFSSN